MKRILLRIAYDGTDYAGWQIQKNAVTVESVLTEALRDLLKEKIELIGASRTDAGVHALGNVAVFDTETRIPPEKIAIAVNQRLPDSIRVQSSEEVTKKFHPRYCDSIKTYEYTILNASIAIPTESRYSYHVYRNLDIIAMRKAAEVLVGTHDFSAFCSAGSQVKSKVRTIIKVEINEIPLASFFRNYPQRKIVIRVSGTGFLYNMVRIIVGTLVEAGEGRRSIETVREAVEKGERNLAGPTAPPQGLMLIGIQYKKQADMMEK